MKTQTTKRTTRRIAASIAIITALATSGAWAATNVDWQGGSGGTEQSPLDIYDPSKYSGGITALSDAYNLMFDASQTPTVLTNSAPAGTKIATSFCPKYGTWTMLGDYKFSNIDSVAGGTTPKKTTIIKKGDWELTYAAYLGRGGVTTVITNVSGNLVQSGSSWFQIGNSSGGTAIVENLSGDWTLAGKLELGHGAGSRGELYWRGGNLTQTYTGSDKFSFGYADNTSAVVEKHAGDWTITDAMIIARGANSTASFKHDGGNLSVGGYLYTSYGSNSVSAIEKNAGDWTVNQLYIGTGMDATSTLVQRGGKITISNTGHSLVLGQYQNSTATVMNDGGDWDLKGKLSVAWASESTATFKHDGGNLTVDGDFYCSYASNSVATVEKNGGDWTLGKTLYLGWGGKNVNSTALTTFYHNGGTMDVASNLDVTYYGSCDFYMNGGEVTVGGEVRFGTWILKNGWHHATVNLNGGVLSAKGFYLNNSDNAKLSKVVFDGGTFKANASGYLVSGASSRYDIADNSKLDALRARFGIEVGPKGGTIDTAGHDITNAVNITRTSGSGGMRFVGGGSVTLTGTVGYRGVTSIDVGTTLEVTNSTAVANILNYGIDVTGYASAGTYTVFRCGDADTLTEDSLAKVTCSFAPESTFAIGEGGKSIEIAYSPIAEAHWTGAAGDNNLSTAGNWSNNTVPTSGSILIASSKPVTLTAGATFSPDTITIPDGSAVITLADSLTLNTLTNANRLAIASTGSLTVMGDLVVFNGKGTFLYSNEGSVTVGRAVCQKGTTARQYAVVTDNAQPIRTGGFLFDRTGDAHVYWRLESGDAGAGAWVVGADGFSFLNAIADRRVRFYTQGNAVTLYSAANWTLDNSGMNSTVNGDLQVISPLTIDTSDYDTPTTPHTVTLEGRIIANSPVTIKGCGTVVVNTTGSHSSLHPDLQHTCITNGTTLAVTDTATLKINAGRKITGNGTISLAAGTTLALDSSALGTIGDTEFASCIPGLALPETGTATIRIDGMRLSYGDHVIATVASGTTDNVTLDPASAALAGRRGNLRVDDGNLILTVNPMPLMITIR